MPVTADVALPPCTQVIKLISQVIADFADGEIRQMGRIFDTDLTMKDYMDKSFYKTASLIAASCRYEPALVVQACAHRLVLHNCRATAGQGTYWCRLCPHGARHSPCSYLCLCPQYVCSPIVTYPAA